MEIDSQPSETKDPTIITEELKTQDEPDSSEDEGIFLARKPAVKLDIQKEETSSPRPKAMLSDDSDEEDMNKSKTAGRRKLAVLSDDEEDSKLAPVEPKRSALLTSDSEEETETVFKKRIQQRPASDSEGSNSDTGEALVRPLSRSSGSSVVKPAYKYSSDIFDAELSDDDSQQRAASPVYSDEDTKPVNKKKKDRRPTAKDREAEVRAIHSESQRMVRESEIALPYHKPKQRSLSEFLSRRKKATPPQFTSRGSIKMSMRNIDTLKLLEQKKKEVEEFYKSDSDHEDPEDRDWTPDQEESKVNEEPLTEKETEKESSEDPTLVKEPVSTVPDDEEEDLPDLIIERTPKSKAVDAGVAESLANSEESVANEQNCELANNIDKVNDSGIQSGSSSPTEDPQIEIDVAAESRSFPRRENEPEENMECSEVDEETPNGNYDGEAVTNMEINQESQELEEAVQGVSLDEDHFLNHNEAANPVSSNIDNAPQLKTPKLSKLAAKIPDLDLSRIAMSTPKLSIGGEDDFIDLEEDSRVTPKNLSGVYDLMSRFVKHSNTKRQLAGKQQVKLSIVSKEKDASGKEKLVASNVVVDVEAEEETRPSEAVPGAGMIKLKSALQAKIREKREQERIRRVKEKQFLETEQVMHDYHDDGTLPNEEDEFTDQSETEYETESEPEENDIIIKDKKQKKSAYVDDEAEEDDDESEEEAEKDNAGDAVDIGNEDSNDTVELPNLNDKDDDDLDDADDDGDKLRLQWEDTQDTNALSRSASIARAASHDHDIFASQSLKKVESLEKDTSITSMDSSFELFGSVIPAHQPGGGLKHANRDRQSESEHEAGFLTPLTKSKSSLFDSFMKERDLSLPIENSQDLFNISTSENSSAYPASCPMNLHLTPILDSQFPQQESNTENSVAAAKLKLDFTGLNTSENHEDDLLDLCSGKFTGSNAPNGIDGLCEDELSPTQDINDLMGLCSGQFASQTKGESSKSFQMPAAFSSENKTNGADEDEDELLNLCSGKFETQVNKEDSASTSGMVSYKKNQDQDSDREGNDSSAEPEMIIDSTDDERQKEKKPAVKRIKKKRRRIIAFSDDEDAQDGVEYDDDAQDALEYDDDEEVVKPRTTFTGFKDKWKGGIRADFLENEAELSESDREVSDDEDERGQDILELEEGDMEEYDEDDLRDQVGRAHLKSLLDSDKREVRLLQEMYLEDGELHGEGRQRRFRWRNVDNDDDGENKRIMSDDEERNEDENEDAEWRRERFEREKFLKEQKEKVENSGNEVFKLDKKTLLRTVSKTSEISGGREPLKEANPAPVAAGPATSEASAINPYSIMKKKGSFLSRDKNTLARIAEFTKDKSTAVGAAKQTGNFVFQHLTAEEVQEKEELNKKLKKSHSLPTAKRAKLDRSFFSMDASTQSSSIFSQLL